MKRKWCSYCTQPVTPFLDLGDTPLADDFPASAEQIETFYPLGLAVCDRCRLVQLDYIVSDDELYGQDYGFYTGASAANNSYWADYARNMKHLIDIDSPRGVLEVACNDGTLMKYLERSFKQVHGVDPAKGPVETARAAGLQVDHDSFGLAYAQRYHEEHGPVDLLIANNVLAHVSNIEDFVKGVSHILSRDGAAVIEVQYLADLLTGNMFDHVYHEHRSYFSLSTLVRCTLGLGLRVFDVQLTPPQGGSIRVFLDKGSRAHEVNRRVETLLRQEAWMSDWGTYDGFQGRVEHIRRRLLDLLWAQKEAGLSVAGYGASAKSTTLLNFCGIGTGILDFVEDTTPSKVGRYTPGMNIPIVAPDPSRPPDVYLMLVWNYASAILARSILANPTTRWILPIPLPVMY